MPPHGETEHWATNDLGMDEWARLKYADLIWSIEVYHRTLKGGCHVEHAMVRVGRAQRNHIGLATVWAAMVSLLPLPCYH